MSAAAPAIAVDGLVVDRDGRRILDEVGFAVGPGEIVGLLGPNGAGKTTTLGVLSTLLRPSGGSVRVAGYDVVSHTKAVRAAIGRVPQDIALYPRLTGRENARFFARLRGLKAAAARRAADDALASVDLLPRADDRAATYSGGMQRRLNLACGLLASPPVLLLDEPTVGVDPQSLERIVTTIRAQAANGAALLYSTHHMDEAEQLCDRVVLIDRGRVLATGTPRKLVASAGVELRVDVATQAALRDGWLAGLAGVRVLESDGPQRAGRHDVAVAIDSLELAPRVLERASGERATVLEFRVQRASLHDAFLALTGRASRD
ncbi:MAG TPA: ABC transporter ATP-binding protein [Gammaproteobacteria bacterium]|nr:ABC transporter ATP-binding protein [Gammaproteobacteria bacterium]